jgi:putative pyruvate formate lyase activating enzyme
MPKPSYLTFYNSNKPEFENRIEKGQKILENCTLCPHNCRVNRLKDKRGVCKTGRLPKVYSWLNHYGEEPPISGTKGSGTIFFANCNMNCIYCQNYEFSQGGGGSETEPEELAKIMLELQHRGCHNINFVSPTHVAGQILEAIYLAIPRGLNIPLVYNTGGYDNLETIGLFEGIVDIYLPDMRYDDEKIAKKYSGIDKYPYYNRQAVKEMFRQVGNPQFDENGIILKGLIIRHLVLPNNLAGTIEVMQFLSKEVSKDTYISLMSQYFPCFKALDDPTIDRRITREEYEVAKSEMTLAGLKNGWFQDEHGLDRFAGTNIKPSITP